MRIQGEVNILGLVHGLRHGLETISSSNWLSLSRLRIVAVVLGATGLILTLRDGKTRYLPGLRSESETVHSSERLYFLAGLENLGNNCFLNVILQALASCGCFHQFVWDIIGKDGLSAKEQIESMPFTVALCSLLRDVSSYFLWARDTVQFSFSELRVLQNEKMVLNPRKVMIAMDDYILNFNLTRQQDAAEALLHLLACLKEEFLDSYIGDCSSFADICDVLPHRIANLKRNGPSEWERWQKYFLGPFDGILCSILSCKSCSSQLSMDFEFFHTLSLPLLLDSNETTMHGCSIVDCLKQFTAVELIENYRCSRCWHVKAMKYLSTVGGDESGIDKLKRCVGDDSCDCRNLIPDGGRLWSDDFSFTLKQLCIGRCPKILCIHLQRASVNGLGEFVKVQGHISFPMILDLFPFTRDAIGIGTESFNENVKRKKVKQNQQSISPLNPFYKQFGTHTLQQMYGVAGESTYPEALVKDVLKSSNCESSHNRCSQDFEGKSGLNQFEGSSDPEFTGMPLQSDNKLNKIPNLVPLKSSVYRLVSVVEHFGRVGSGHYAVYRWARDESVSGDSVGKFEPGHWYCISDSDVARVSEPEVLSAEASLLFYERIEEPI